MAFPEELDVIMCDDKLFDKVLDAIMLVPEAEVIPVILREVEDYQKRQQEREFADLQTKDFRDAMERDVLNEKVDIAKKKLLDILKNNGVTKDMERSLRLGAHDAEKFTAAKSHADFINNVQNLLTAFSNVSPSLSNQALRGLILASDELTRR